LPLHGHELGPGINPLEAGLGWVVAWDKPGGFRGREALMACRQQGARRALRGVVAHGRQPLREGYPLLVDGDAVGALSSGNYSPVLGCGIGLGFVPSQTDYGAAVQVDARGRHLEARVTRLPFVPHRRGAPAAPDQGRANQEGGQ
jgi:aminomethyltransferase